MKKKIIGIFLVIIFLLLVFNVKSNAATPLDEIQNYEITIDMNEDRNNEHKISY